jgi:hypothetical protein
MGYGNGRKRRLRRRVDRFGSSSESLKWKNTSKAVAESGLPGEISEVVIESDALVGDVWRLACEEVKFIKKPCIYTHRKFEQLYEIAIEYCTVDEKVNYIKAGEEYKILCKDEFNLIEVQERRLAFKTPTKKLIADSRCMVVPPLWKYSKRRIRRTNCKSKPPPVVNVEPELEYKDLDLTCCLICGYFVKPTVVMNGTQRLIHYNEGDCISCKRRVHKKCVAGLFLKAKSFRCCLVKYHLGECGQNIQGPSGPLDMVPPGRCCDLCLICGDLYLICRDLCLKCGDLCLSSVISTFNAPSNLNDAVNDEITCATNLFKFVYVGLSISKFLLQIS